MSQNLLRRLYISQVPMDDDDNTDLEMAARQVAPSRPAYGHTLEFWNATKVINCGS